MGTPCICNAYGRVIAHEKDGIRVANMNMPFQGTLSYYLVKQNKYKVCP
jgi:hypothetical protein